MILCYTVVLHAVLPLSNTYTHLSVAYIYIHIYIVSVYRSEKCVGHLISNSIKFVNWFIS